MDATEPTLDISPGKAILHLEEELGLREPELAGALGASGRTLERWRSRASHSQRAASGSCLPGDWRTRSERTEPPRPGCVRTTDSVGGMKPSDAIRAGRVDRVEAALEALDSGSFL